MMLSLIAIARMVRTSHELVSQLIDALVGVGWTRRDAAKLVDSALAAAQAAPLGSRVDFERRDTSPSGADLRGLFSSVSQAIIDEKGWDEERANDFTRGLFRAGLILQSGALEAGEGVLLTSRASPTMRGDTGLRRNIQGLVRLAMPQWPRMAAGIALIAMTSLLDLYWPRVAGGVMDEIAAGTVDGVISRGITLLLVLTTCGALGATQAHILRIAGARVVASLRASLFARIMQKEMAFFDQSRVGDLMSRLSGDTARVGDLVSYTFCDTIGQLVVVIGTVVVLMTVSWKLAAFLVLMWPLTLLARSVFERKLEQLAAESQRRLAAASMVAHQAFMGIRTIRLLDRADAEIEHYRLAMGRLVDVASQRSRVVSGLELFVASSGYLLFGLVFMLGGVLVIRGELSVGELTAVLMYAMLIRGSLMVLIRQAGELVETAGATGQIFELLDAPDEVATAVGSRRAPPPPCDGPLSVEFLDVDFAYPSRPNAPVLRGVSLRVAAGETVAVVGASGGGKSTLLNLLARFYRPSAGRILLGGVDIQELPDAELRRRVGAVEQQPFIFADTIGNNIRYGTPCATERDVVGAAMRAAAHDFIVGLKCGYDTRLGEGGVGLSGGQKQRIAIARVLLRGAPVVFLDEATSALDTHAEEAVKNDLVSLRGACTVIIVTHRLSTAIAADRIFVMSNGAVEQVGTHEELMSVPGSYRSLVSGSRVGGEGTGLVFATPAAGANSRG